MSAGACNCRIENIICDACSRIGSSKRNSAFEFKGLGIGGGDGVEAAGKCRPPERGRLIVIVFEVAGLPVAHR